MQIAKLLALAALTAVSAGWAGAAPAVRAEPPGGDLSAVDPSIAPGDDFFRYANGPWLKAVEIPADRGSWGTFEQLAESADQHTRSLVRQLGKDRRKLTDEQQKVADYYAGFMDDARIEARGLAPLTPELERIAKIADREDLARWLGSTLRADVDVLNNTVMHTGNVFGVWIAQDLDHPTRYVPFLIQGGLAMPDRDYYLADSPQMVEIREKYLGHVAAMLELAGSADPQGEARRVYDLERRIAAVHETRTESEDVKKGDNHWSRAQLKSRAPGLDWDACLGSAGLDGDDFIVWQPPAVIGIAALAGSEDLETWRAYLRFHLLEHAAPFLPSAYVNEHFKFFGAVLNGTPQLRERWKRGIQATNEALGEAVGKLYVQRYFPADAKAKIQAMVRQLLAAYAVRIDRLTWMAPETRARAKAKLSALRVGIAYPDRWRSYSGLEIARGDAYGNFERAERFNLQYQLSKLGKTVDRSEWVTAPQVVNAFNLPAMNAINFPAAILQPPFFDERRSAAANYGAIGATIGHEISHSFDDQGALFDFDGRFANWWTPADLQHFEAAGVRLVDQYDQYRPLPDMTVNGKLTLSENIADVAGLAAAYDAFHLAARKPSEAQGSSGDRQFFLSFAQSFRGKSRDPALRQQLVADGHSPDEYRADTVRNLTAWYEAYGVRPGQRLYLAPSDRVTIW